MMKIRVRDKINYERLEKQKQKELYQAKLQFFTNASHELKNPAYPYSGTVGETITWRNR